MSIRGCSIPGGPPRNAVLIISNTEYRPISSSYDRFRLLLSPPLSLHFRPLRVHSDLDA